MRSSTAGWPARSLYANAALRADAGVLLQNRRGQSGLWGYAISGDLPIVLLQIGDAANIELVRQLVQAHAYWRLKGLAVDLVIWNEDRAGYRQLLQDQIMGLIAAGIEAHVIDRPGGIFVRRAEQISRRGPRAAAVGRARRSFSDQPRHAGRAGRAQRGAPSARVPRLQPCARRAPSPRRAAPHAPRATLTFVQRARAASRRDGREYVITTGADASTPAPWVNVLANPHFGTRRLRKRAAPTPGARTRTSSA